MKARTIRDVAALARERRTQLGWSQAGLASAAGVGREWIVEFEKGKSTVEWGLVMRTLQELGLTIELSIEESTPDQHSVEGGESDVDAILGRHRKS